MSQINDIALVAQVVVFKNTRAFDTLVKKYQSPIRRFFLHQTLGDTELSDDLAQETFIKAYTNLASFKNLSSFSTWLYRIAYNIFYDYIRSKKETSGLETWEIDAVYQTEQRQVGEHMDIYRGLSPIKRGRANLHHLIFYGRSSDRKNCSDYRNACRNNQVPFITRKNKIDNFLKTEWL